LDLLRSRKTLHENFNNDNAVISETVSLAKERLLEFVNGTTTGAEIHR